MVSSNGSSLLNVMHVVAAAATVWALRRFLPVAAGSAA
jgi:hypothetical protein